MSPYELRAQLLMSRERFLQAAELLREGLVQEPNSARLHAQLAVCLSQTGQLAEAEEHARDAIGLAPEDAMSYRALALVHLEQRAWSCAHSAVQSALGLEPEEANSHVLLARAYAGERRWRQVLAAAEQGLRIDPASRGCQNLRALAQLGLGDVELTAEIVAQSLAQRPEDAWVHACRGWVHCIHSQPKPAIEAFRESLRLNPDLEWAREGLVKSLKSRHWFYRLMITARDETIARADSSFVKQAGRKAFRLLRLSLWVIGFYFVVLNVTLMLHHPIPVAYWYWAVLAAVLYGLLCTLVINPLADLVLLLDPFARHVLKSREVQVAKTTVIALGAPLPFVILSLTLGADTRDMASSLVLAIIAVPSYLASRFLAGRRKTISAVFVLLLLFLGIMAALPVGRLGSEEFKTQWDGTRAAAVTLFQLGSWISCIAILRCANSP